MSSLNSMSSIFENLAEVKKEMAQACERAGRAPDSVTLCVVSKNFPAASVQQAYDAGQRDFGENRVQEMLDKAKVLPPDIQWHLIGHLQTNKARKALTQARTVQSVDSLALAQTLSRISGELGHRTRIFLQVNIAHDPAKHGWLAPDLHTDFPSLLKLPHLEIGGLMTIPELAETPAQAQPHFAALRQFRDTLQQEFQAPLPHLSMGMSGDFPVAIAEGATVIRVGTRIFGSR